ncbi:MAG: hypothetical protein P4L83_03330 [Nevskia sp.]|nr:hypothetical protein [Nevskia sp.]
MGRTLHARPPAARLLLLLAAGCCAGAGAAPPELHFSGSAGLGYDSNPANAETGSTLPATGYAVANLAASMTRTAGEHVALLLRGSLDGQQYFDYVGLSNAKAGVLARGLYRPGGGFYMPTFAAWGSAALWEFRSHMRGGAEYRAGAYASEQLTTAIDLRLGGYASERDSHSGVFDLRGQAATLDADWMLGDALTAYLGYEFRQADFAVSSAPDPGAAAYAAVLQADDSLGSNGVPNTVYRLRGHAQIGTLGLNYALTPGLALDAQGQQIHTRAESGDHYNRWLTTVSLLARF